MKPRTRARSLALQVLYEVDIANHPPGDIYKLRLEETPLSDELSDFARQIIFGVLPLTQYTRPNHCKIRARMAARPDRRDRPQYPAHGTLGIRGVSRYARSRLPSTKLWNWQSNTALILRRVLSTVCSVRWQTINMKFNRQFKIRNYRYYPQDTYGNSWYWRF